MGIIIIIIIVSTFYNGLVVEGERMCFILIYDIKVTWQETCHWIAFPSHLLHAIAITISPSAAITWMKKKNKIKNTFVLFCCHMDSNENFPIACNLENFIFTFCFLFLFFFFLLFECLKLLNSIATELWQPNSTINVNYGWWVYKGFEYECIRWNDKILDDVAISL